MVEQSNVVKNTLSKPEVHEGWKKFIEPKKMSVIGICYLI